VADVTENAAQGSGKKSAKPAGKHVDKNMHGLEIRDPDGFQDTMINLWAWLEKHSASVVGIVVLLFLGGIVTVIVGWYGRHEEHKAQDAFFAVESKYTKIKEGFDRAKMQAALPQLAKKDDKKNPAKDKTEDKEKSQDVLASGDLTKDYGTVISDLEGVARQFKGSSAGAQAGILAADVYLNYNQPEKAAAVAEETVNALGDKHLLANLARLQWGSALATKGDCKTAVAVWQPILENKDVAFLQGDASLRSGICYETLNDNVKAMEMYNKVLAEGGQGSRQESPSASIAKGLLRALELKTKSAVPAVPAKQG